MYKVILVDDEPIIVQGLTKVVEWESYNCEVIATAEDAITGAEAIKKFKPDILITDIKMPDNDGLCMLAALRSEFPDMQVTVLSGHSDFSYAQQAITLGVCRYLLKPSKMDEIQEALSEMTKRLDNKVHTPETHAKSSQDTVKGGDSSEASSFIVRQAISYIEENHQNKLSLAEVADKSYVSQWHLSKLLNRHAGKNFYDILNEVRISKAKKLLENASLRISDISDMVGYSDSAHFSRVFKKETGMSAHSYRNTFL